MGLGCRAHSGGRVLDGSLNSMHESLHATHNAVFAMFMLQVGRQLFDHLICGLLASSTRLLVTHQLQVSRERPVPELYSILYGILEPYFT